VNPIMEHVFQLEHFIVPNMSKIDPVPDIVKGKTDIYKTKNHEDFIRLVFANELGGKTLLDHMKS
jgi:hypothetical protein